MKMFFATDIHGSEICWKKFLNAAAFYKADLVVLGGAIPCILNGGNDDIFEIDPILESSPAVTFAEGKVIDLGGFTMISMGYTNPTPWDTHREAPEDELAMRIDAIAARVPDMNRTI